MSDDGAWQVLRSRPLYDRPFLTLREEQVRLSNGHEIDDFCVIDAPSWVAVLCLTEDEHVVLVRQYRHGIRRWTDELPAGAIEPGEEPLRAARRELLEETGYEAPDWSPLTTLAVDPSRNTSFAHFFVARQARQVAAATPEPSEQIQMLRVSKQVLLEGVLGAARERGPSIDHGQHVAAILIANARGLLGR